MSIFKRLSATLVATVEQTVASVENHDAIVDAAIKEARQSAARARVRLARVRKDGQDLDTRIAEHKSAEQKWSERAKSCAVDDEAKALDCLRRRKQCLAQLATLQKSQIRHKDLEQQMTASVASIEQRLRDTTEQRNMMRSRQSAADAHRLLNKLEGSACGDIDETFDRWEMRVTESEYAAGDYNNHDGVEQQFIDEEDDEELRAQLRELVNEKGTQS